MFINKGKLLSFLIYCLFICFSRKNFIYTCPCSQENPKFCPNHYEPRRPKNHCLGCFTIKSIGKMADSESNTRFYEQTQSPYVFLYEQVKVLSTDDRTLVMRFTDKGEFYAGPP